jgi:hypothetical protein
MPTRTATAETPATNVACVRACLRPVGGGVGDGMNNGSLLLLILRSWLQWQQQRDVQHASMKMNRTKTRVGSIRHLLAGGRCPHAFPPGAIPDEPFQRSGVTDAPVLGEQVQQLPCLCAESMTG